MSATSTVVSGSSSAPVASATSAASAPRARRGRGRPKRAVASNSAASAVTAPPPLASATSDSAPGKEATADLSSAVPPIASETAFAALHAVVANAKRRVGSKSKRSVFFQKEKEDKDDEEWTNPSLERQLRRKLNDGSTSSNSAASGSASAGAKGASAGAKGASAGASALKEPVNGRVSEEMERLRAENAALKKQVAAANETIKDVKSTVEKLLPTCSLCLTPGIDLLRTCDAHPLCISCYLCRVHASGLYKLAWSRHGHPGLVDVSDASEYIDYDIDTLHFRIHPDAIKQLNCAICKQAPKWGEAVLNSLARRHYSEGAELIDRLVNWRGTNSNGLMFTEDKYNEMENLLRAHHSASTVSMDTASAAATTELQQQKKQPPKKQLTKKTLVDPKVAAAAAAAAVATLCKCSCGYQYNPVVPHDFIHHRFACQHTRTWSCSAADPMRLIASFTEMSAALACTERFAFHSIYANAAKTSTTFLETMRKAFLHHIRSDCNLQVGNCADCGNQPFALSDWDHKNAHARERVRVNTFRRMEDLLESNIFARPMSIKSCLSQNQNMQDLHYAKLRAFFLHALSDSIHLTDSELFRIRKAVLLLGDSDKSHIRLLLDIVCTAKDPKFPHAERVQRHEHLLRAIGKTKVWSSRMFEALSILGGAHPVGALMGPDLYNFLLTDMKSSAKEAESFSKLYRNHRYELKLSLPPGRQEPIGSEEDTDADDDADRAADGAVHEEEKAQIQAALLDSGRAALARASAAAAALPAPAALSTAAPAASAFSAATPATSAAVAVAALPAPAAAAVPAAPAAIVPAAAPAAIVPAAAAAAAAVPAAPAAIVPAASRASNTDALPSSVLGPRFTVMSTSVPGSALVSAAAPASTFPSSWVSTYAPSLVSAADVAAAALAASAAAAIPTTSSSAISSSPSTAASASAVSAGSAASALASLGANNTNAVVSPVHRALPPRMQVIRMRPFQAQSNPVSSQIARIVASLPLHSNAISSVPTNPIPTNRIPIPHPIFHAGGNPISNQAASVPVATGAPPAPQHAERDSDYGPNSPSYDPREPDDSAFGDSDF